MTIAERSALASQPIVWKGDLTDDCTAIWAGLMLRAECMDGNDWWWIVYDLELPGGPAINEDGEHGAMCRGGGNARKKAEDAARLYMQNLHIG